MGEGWFHLGSHAAECRGGCRYESVCVCGGCAAFVKLLWIADCMHCIAAALWAAVVMTTASKQMYDTPRTIPPPRGNHHRGRLFPRNWPCNPNLTLNRNRPISLKTVILTITLITFIVTLHRTDNPIALNFSPDQGQASVMVIFFWGGGRRGDTGGGQMSVHVANTIACSSQAAWQWLSVCVQQINYCVGPLISHALAR